MSSENSASWADRLLVLRGLRPSVRRDIELSHLFDEPFDGDIDRCVDQLFLSFTSQIDLSVLQAAENAFGRVDYRDYYLGLGRCFEVMVAISPKIAVERINYPSRELLGAEMEEGFRLLISGFASSEPLAIMRHTIVEWGLLDNEPYRTFFHLSQLWEG